MAHLVQHRSRPSGPGHSIPALRTSAYADPPDSRVTSHTPRQGTSREALQPTAPTSSAQAANWVPTPHGQGFEVAWRLFAPDSDAIPGILDGSGWQPPQVTPAGATS